MVTEYATCLTGECVSFGLPIPVLRSDSGVRVVCGPCGEFITDITDIEPESGRELPAWILEKLQTVNSAN